MDKYNTKELDKVGLPLFQNNKYDQISKALKR